MRIIFFVEPILCQQATAEHKNLKNYPTPHPSGENNDMPLHTNSAFDSKIKYNSTIWAPQEVLSQQTIPLTCLVRCCAPTTRISWNFTVRVFTLHPLRLCSPSFRPVMTLSFRTVMSLQQCLHCQQELSYTILTYVILYPAPRYILALLPRPPAHASLPHPYISSIICHFSHLPLLHVISSPNFNVHQCSGPTAHWGGERGSFRSSTSILLSKADQESIIA